MWFCLVLGRKALNRTVHHEISGLAVGLHYSRISQIVKAPNAPPFLLLVRLYVIKICERFT